MPHQADHPHFLSGARKWEALRRSKVIVNVHRQPLAYVEWQRLVGAMANGCVVVTEHCLGFDPLVPNEHFVAATYDHLQDAVDALLRDPDMLRDIRQAAYALWRDRHPLSESVGVLSDTLCRARRRAAHEARRGAPDDVPAAATPRPAPAPLRAGRPAAERRRDDARRAQAARPRAAPAQARAREPAGDRRARPHARLAGVRAGGPARLGGRDGLQLRRRRGGRDPQRRRRRLRPRGADRRRRRIRRRLARRGGPGAARGAVASRTGHRARPQRRARRRAQHGDRRRPRRVRVHPRRGQHGLPAGVVEAGGHARRPPRGGVRLPDPARRSTTPAHATSSAGWAGTPSACGTATSSTRWR